MKYEDLRLYIYILSLFLEFYFREKQGIENDK